MILIIDNYDSFTFNVAHAFGTLGMEVKVVRNDHIAVEEIEGIAPEAIVISPGPGRPEDSGITCETIKNYAGKIPILGICLGHQAIGYVFGATVSRAKLPVHGKVSKIFHDSSGIFADLPNPFPATRYHSLIVQRDTITEPLTVTAETSEGEVMGIRGLEMKIEGVQFHPESIATKHGAKLFQNFVAIHLAKESQT
ncbi:MAG: aminodeoxychorismate/anthranilate synthase component II [Pseudomonadota bacterium]